MKISRTIGRSTSNHTTNTDGSRGLKRNHQIVKKTEGTANSTIDDLKEFLNTDPGMVIRQTISVLDKILNKKDALKPMSRSVIEARESLGQALLTVYRDKGHVVGQDQFKGEWDWKLHPYSKGESIQADLATHKRSDNVRLFSKAAHAGQWKDAFWIVKNGAPDYPAIAEKIYAHLFVARVRRRDGATVTQKKAGLSETRAVGIEQSVYGKVEQLSALDIRDWGARQDLGPRQHPSPVGQYYSTTNDVAKKIFEAAIAKEESDYPGRIKYSDAGRILYDHLGLIIKAFVDQYASDEGMDPKDVDPKGDTEYEALWATHREVQSFYKNILRKSKRGKNEAVEGRGMVTRQTISSRLPRNSADLKRRLSQSQDNGLLMDLVRHGRVLYYDHINPSSTTSTGNHETSSYWTSDGQAEIKRLEGSARAWRTAMVQASRTLRSWADPKHTMQHPDGPDKDFDILSTEVIGQIVVGSGEAPQLALNQLPILFGAKAHLFGYDETKNSQLALATLELCLRATAGLRNETFHFSNHKTFAAKIENVLGTTNNLVNTRRSDAAAAVGAARDLFAGDTADRNMRLLDDLKGFGALDYATEEQFINLVELVREQRSHDMPLPRFNRILARWQGIVGPLKIEDNDLRKSLPEVASFSGLKDQWASCKFNCAKLIYDTGFRHWLLDEQNWSKLAARIDDAQTQGDTLARIPQGAKHKNRHFDQVKSQSFKLGKLKTDDNLKKYFIDIDARVATENRDNQRYEANAVVAADKSDWINDFKADLLAYLFCDYLEATSQEWVLAIKEDSPLETWIKKFEGTSGGDDWRTKLTLSKSDVQTIEQWQSVLYTALHLVPVDDVSRLLHQMRKSEVLTAKAAPQTGTTAPSAPLPLDNLAKMRGVLTLYLDMQNAKFDGDAVASSIEPFRGLFEPESLFDEIHDTSVDGDHLIQNTQRGLREILRHGDLTPLLPIFQTSKVISDDLTFYHEMTTKMEGGQSEIARLQKQKKGFNTLAKEAPLYTNPKVEEYIDCFTEIKKFRDTAGKIRLSDHVAVHHLLMRVLARLVDYCGIWERDRFFVYLALYARENGDLSDINTCDKRKKAINKKFSKAGLRKAAVAQLTQPHQDYFEKYFSEGICDLRNNISHFNFFKTSSDGSVPFDLLTLITDVRKIMSYDRKLKNAVTRSVIDIFDKEGFILELDFKDHKPTLKSLKSKSIRHLKKAKAKFRKDGKGKKLPPTHDERAIANRLFEDLKSPELVAMVKQLLQPVV